MRTRGSLALALGLLAGGCGEVGPSERAPNLLVITLDTARRDFMGFHGRAPSPTPHLDALAAESIVFEDAFTVAPLTLPAHVSLFTGLYPATHGVRDNSALRLSGNATTLAECLDAAGYATGAVVASAVLDPAYGLEQGFGSYSAPRRFPGEAGEHYVERRAAGVVEEALARLDALPEPFAFWVHLFDPHAPYDAPLSTAPGDALTQRYAEEIAYADGQIGRLLDGLRAGPRWERTVVVFTADHGEGLETGREPTHGHFVDDDTMRVPLLLRDPRRPAGRVDEVVSLVDVTPTLLRWLGTPGPGRELDGVDLTPVVEGGDLAPREVALESYYVLRNFGWAPFEALVTRERRFVRSARCELLERGGEGATIEPDAARAAPWLERLEARFGAGPEPGLVVEVAVSPEEARSLAALGYAAGGPGRGSGLASGLTSERPDFDALPDATTKLDLIARLAAVHAALGRGEVERALALLERSCREEPASSTFHFELASTLLAHRPERWEEAEAALERAVALDPWRADALSNLGALHVQRWERAAEEARALQGTGRDAEARERQRAARDARERAAVHLRRALERLPNQVEALANLVRVLQVEAERAAARGERAEARALYAEVVELLTRFLSVLPEESDERGERARAEAAFERARRRLAVLR